MFTSFWNTNGEHIKSIVRGAVVAGIGAGATAILQVLSHQNFGEYTVFVAAGLSVLANIIRKFGIPVGQYIIATVVAPG